MENYILYEEISLPVYSDSKRYQHYKGRRRGTVNFVSIEQFSKSVKHFVANGVCYNYSLTHA